MNDRRRLPVTLDLDLVDEKNSAQRTELAWTRSGLAVLGCFAILARHVWTSGAERGDVLAVVLLALATLGWAIGIGFGTIRHRGREPAPLGPSQLLVVAAATVSVGVAGIVIAFVHV
jgi:hypothetical protein